MSAVVDEAPGDWAVARWYVTCDACAWMWPTSGLVDRDTATMACEDHNDVRHGRRR